MKPPYQITPQIIKLISSISEKIGQINAKFLDKPSPKLRKENRIKTIHSSLSIEGNTLTQDQITALLENKRVIGPIKDVSEVLNAIKVYDKLKSFDPYSSTSFLDAHKVLMNDLIDQPGKYRTKGVGIVTGDKITHMAPPADNVVYLMKDLFTYLKKSEEIDLIKSCVFHYEMEFIHPFEDGNGRMGRLWQTLILTQTHPVFEFIPFESLIHDTQHDYYAALSESDKTGSSTPFIFYMLNAIDRSLFETLNFKSRTMTSEDRITYFSEVSKASFTRKDYMMVFTDVSSATASRDLKLGVDLGIFLKEGDKKKTVYKLKT
ncbi:MAG: Fic family protein [Crocinitomicaceae bacterium]|nr:Fic family protein [Crocinitomicaceae bacterium]